ncbi:MAG TPA: glycine/sarcosine/betaine reductase component B subunit, partial [Candidatus Binatia bacterium]|nr:glycine/sarcosine/betaine reductase component B subunit [Candidatus Binatia bacterium]
MQLTLAIHPISETRFDSKTRLNGATLCVSKEELRRLVLEDSSFEGVNFEIARPGESLRAGPVFDIVEPRAKAPGGSPDWPGILGAPETAGAGTTHVLQGAAVTLLREQSTGDSRGAVGYVLEMSGAPAENSPYASVNHLIIIPHTPPGLPEHSRQRAYRVAQLRIAVYLARAALNATPAQTQALDISA